MEASRIAIGRAILPVRPFQVEAVRLLQSCGTNDATCLPCLENKAVDSVGFLCAINIGAIDCCRVGFVLKYFISTSKVIDS